MAKKDNRDGGKNMTVYSSNIGYPRIGEKREWKKALERFWEGTLEEKEFKEELDHLFLEGIRVQKEAGITHIPVGEFSLYDHILDLLWTFDLVPDRFKKTNKTPLETYYSMARGTDGAEAMTMTKWFNTNYHYIVPEFENVTPSLKENRFLDYWKKAKQKLGINGKVTLVGPATLVLLGKGYKETEKASWIQRLIPLYQQLLQQLDEEGVEWVSLEEPIFTSPLDQEVWKAIENGYAEIAKSCKNTKLLVQTYYEAVFDYKKVLSLPVDGFGLDFIHDRGETKEQLKKWGFPKGKVLAAGVIDGRNVWKSNLTETSAEVKELLNLIHGDLWVQPSSSLLHVPVTAKNESLPSFLEGALSFAKEKLGELKALESGIENNTSFKDYDKSFEAFVASSLRHNHKVQGEIKELAQLKVTRPPYEIRAKKQQEKLKLPLLPTTTIGSMPQTKEVRSTRLKWRKKQITDAQYEQFIQEITSRWIAIQEDLGLDVLVHGEFERTDMVEYFGEKLNGMEVTKFGWVQSYGSRCVKPPLIYGDVSLKEPMTVKESVYAQSLTNKPVKGMLTGPVTILNWSFPRHDESKEMMMNQIGLAIRQEVLALEDAGIAIIQIDEPALREGLPLREEKKEGYLKAAAYAFRLSSYGVKDETQIHTHMCYSNFNEIMNTIDDLDADVISIETSRSHGRLLQAFEDFHYEKEIGLGVYDIHSPQIPNEEDIISNIRASLRVLDEKQFWVNPDCGLKTRKEEEAVKSLRVLVEATKKYRASLVEA
jgi:5-methyltetrahydropteroyltriglutamate--homocysteine methyltransferase